MRKRPIYGRSTRSTSSKAVTIKNHQKQSNYQVGEREGEYFIVKASQELMEKVNSFIQILKSHHRLFFAVKNVVI